MSSRSTATTKPSRAEFSVDAADKAEGEAVAVLRLSGAWVVTQIEGKADRLTKALKPYGKVKVDAEAITALDTAGAYLLKIVIGERLDGDIFAGHDNYQRLYRLVGDHTPSLDSYDQENPEKPKFWLHPIYLSLIGLGRLMTAFGRGFVNQSIFMGHVITLLLISIARPSRMRWAALFNIMQRAGLEAIPIVALTNAFVGAVLAFLMVLSLKVYGGAVFSVDFVCIGVMREFAPVIAAVLIAGRSASGFAAEIGSMKMNQEIDAMRVMGIDPYEALVLPRVLALTIMTPLITFIGVLSGMVGGMLAIWGSLGLGPDFFVQRLYDYVPSVNLFVGMVRTPVFAITIAIVGCRLGMTVKNDVISLGRQVTTAVVQSIFLVFMIDAMFAILFNGFVF